MSVPTYTISAKAIDLVARFAKLGILSVDGKNKGRKYVINKIYREKNAET